MELINVLLVGGMRMDHCLPEEKKHGLITQTFNCFLLFRRTFVLDEKLARTG